MPLLYIRNGYKALSCASAQFVWMAEQLLHLPFLHLLTSTSTHQPVCAALCLSVVQFSSLDRSLDFPALPLLAADYSTTAQGQSSSCLPLSVVGCWRRQSREAQVPPWTAVSHNGEAQSSTHQLVSGGANERNGRKECVATMLWCTQIGPMCNEVVHAHLNSTLSWLYVSYHSFL